jgi:hypothetical protein
MKRKKNDGKQFHQYEKKNQAIISHQIIEHKKEHDIGL